MAQLHLQLVSPAGKLLDGQADSLTAPTQDGQITILPHHVPLVASLRPGELVARIGNETHYIHVAGGFIQVHPDSSVIILADAAEHVAALDEEHVVAAKRHAEELLAQTNLSDEEYAQAAASLELHLSKLSTIKRHKHRTRRPITSEGVLNE